MGILEMSLWGGIIILIVVLIRSLALTRLPKNTFPVLWGIALFRLLMPFSIESAASVQNMIPIEKLNTGTLPGVSEAVQNTFHAPAAAPAAINAGASSVPPGSVTFFEGISPLAVVWISGVIALAIYFAVAYIRYRRMFSCALPADNSYIAGWLKNNRLKRPVAVKISDRINTPLAYGLFRPVVLLPKSTDWTDTNRLNFILAHEFAHIKRLDPLWKILLAAALCMHWFNPLVWLLYVLANRDLELACDESVIKTVGGPSSYALTLLSMEEKKSMLLPLASSFSRYAIKERIESIMKYKKATVLVIIIAVILVAGVTTAFATCAPEEKSVLEEAFGYSGRPDTVILTEEECDALLWLKLDGYKDKTINDFVNSIDDRFNEFSPQGEECRRAYQKIRAGYVLPETLSREEKYFLNVILPFALNECSENLLTRMSLMIGIVIGDKKDYAIAVSFPITFAGRWIEIK